MKQRRIDLKVGYLCNDDCVHCAIAHNRQRLQSNNIETELTTNQVKQLIDRYSEQYSHVTLTGGEITIRKDFLDIIKYASDKFQVVDVQTNGRKLATAQNIDQLSQLNNIDYVISIHGPNKDIHECITRKPHSFEQTVNSIRKMVCLPNKPRVLLKFVVSNYNKDYICDTVQFAYDLGCRYIDIAYMHGCTDNYQTLQQLLPSYGDIKEGVNKAIEFGKNLGVRVTVETFPLCVIASKHYDSIDEMVLSSMDMSVQAVGEDVYNWNEVRINNNKLKTNQCNNCSFRNNCEGPWEEYWDIHGGQGLNAILPNKPAIPLISQNRASVLSGYAQLFKVG